MLIKVKSGSSYQAYCPFPVGGVYLSAVNCTPSSLWPGTTWERIASGTFLAASGGSTSGDYSVGKTGGAASVTLSVGQMPKHTHDTKYILTGFCGSGGTWLPQYTSAGGASGTNVESCYNLDTGGGKAHENRPPYLAVDMWKRTK